MYLFFNNQDNQKIYLSILLGIIPFSFIAGNMIININIILLIISSFLIFKSNLLKINYFFLDKIILIFFFLILLTAVINDYHFYNLNLEWRTHWVTVLKSVFFLKYLLTYLILRSLIEKKHIDLKYLFWSSFLATVFVCFDIFFQFVFGRDVFGFTVTGGYYNLSGPFGDELIAGGFLQRFSLFAFFLIPIFYSNISSKLSKLIIIFLLLIFICGIILSGNRMPLLLFIFSVCLLFLFFTEIRKYFILFIPIFFLVIFLFYNFNDHAKYKFINFGNQISSITKLIIKKDFYNKNAPLYLVEFRSFYHTWQLNKYLGGGIKNFRYYCRKRADVKFNTRSKCNMHPHNYYLEILTETGIVGFFLLVTIFSTIIIISLKNYSLFDQKKSKEVRQIIPILILFFIEIFPIKSTGSFFTTGNTTYLFILMGLLVGLVRKEKLIDNKI